MFSFLVRIFFKRPSKNGLLFHPFPRKLRLTYFHKILALLCPLTMKLHLIRTRKVKIKIKDQNSEEYRQKAAAEVCEGGAFMEGFAALPIKNNVNITLMKAWISQ